MLGRSIDGIPYFAFESFEDAGARAIVTTRDGGDSAPPYNSLNLSTSTGDDEDAVRRNQDRLATILDVAPAGLTFAGQVHGSRVEVVTKDGAGTKFPDTDALVTDVPGVPLVILTADCVAVLLLDPGRRVVGIAHAGWRGTLAEIATTTIATMVENFGATPERIVAAIGPSIGPCCYEVGSDVVDAFFAEQPEIADDVLTTSDFASAGSFEESVNTDKKNLDLWRANYLQLLAAGVPDDNIDVTATCTSCNTGTFYSHRAENGRTGRFAHAICLGSA